MKTLFIVSTGLNKPTDDVIRQREIEDFAPRTTLLENELNTTLLDERYLQNIHGFRSVFYKWLPTNLSQILEALIIQKKYDALISYYERVGLPFAFFQKIFRSQTPHILLTTWFSNKKKAWFMKHAQDHLAKIITWSSNQYQFALSELGISPDKIKLIKRGVDHKFWRPFDMETNTICSAGMEMRDYPTLIQALEPLDIPCHIATGAARGKLFETVKNLYALDDIPDQITIGVRKANDLRRLYARSRFVVVPLLETDTDNGLTVILEAMAMGKAVICSKVAGQIDVLQDGVTGMYVKQGDPEALREAIQYLWDNPKKAEEMGKAARKYIEQYHTLEEFVSNIKDEVELAVHKKTTSSPEFTLEELSA